MLKIVLIGGDELESLLIPGLERLKLRFMRYSDPIEAAMSGQLNQIDYLIYSIQVPQESLEPAREELERGWAIIRVVDPFDPKLVEAILAELQRRKPPAKRVLFWGRKEFLVQMGEMISPETCNVCYAIQAEMTLNLAERGAIDLICLDNRSVPWGEIDQVRKLIQTKRLKVKLLVFEPTDERSAQKLLAELQGD